MTAADLYRATHPQELPAEPTTAVVRYRVTVYATVDLVAGTVTDVAEDLDSIRLDLADGDPEDQPDRLLEIVETEPDAGPAEPLEPHPPRPPRRITPELAARAVEIAENSADGWPAWNR